MSQSEAEILKEIDKFFKDTFLYGWTDQTEDEIERFSNISSKKQQKFIQKELLARSSQGTIDKTGLLLTLLLFKRFGKDYFWLSDFAQKHLSDKLYIKDFRMLIKHLFDNELPLSNNLVYNITERILLNFESDYDKIVEDFKSVPIQNAEKVVLFLILHNCRVDLNTQNKEMINLIISHIKNVEIPKEIRDSVESYLEKTFYSRVLNSKEEMQVDRHKFQIYFKEKKPQPKQERRLDLTNKEISESGEPEQEAEAQTVYESPSTEEQPEKPALDETVKGETGDTIPRENQSLEMEAGAEEPSAPEPPVEEDVAEKRKPAKGKAAKDQERPNVSFPTVETTASRSAEEETTETSAKQTAPKEGEAEAKIAGDETVSQTEQKPPTGVEKEQPAEPEKKDVQPVLETKTEPASEAGEASTQERPYISPFREETIKTQETDRLQTADMLNKRHMEPEEPVSPFGKETRDTRDTASTDAAFQLSGRTPGKEPITYASGKKQGEEGILLTSLKEIRSRLFNRISRKKKQADADTKGHAEFFDGRDEDYKKRQAEQEVPADTSGGTDQMFNGTKQPSVERDAAHSGVEPEAGHIVAGGKRDVGRLSGVGKAGERKERPDIDLPGFLKRFWIPIVVGIALVLVIVLLVLQPFGTEAGPGNPDQAPREKSEDIQDTGSTTDGGDGGSSSREANVDGTIADRTGETATSAIADGPGGSGGAGAAPIEGQDVSTESLPENQGEQTEGIEGVGMLRADQEGIYWEVAPGDSVYTLYLQIQRDGVQLPDNLKPLQDISWWEFFDALDEANPNHTDFSLIYPGQKFYLD